MTAAAAKKLSSGLAVGMRGEGGERPRMRAYPEYKDSGVEWLGRVPSHWDVKAVKRLSPVLRGASPRPIDDPKYFDDEGEYAWTRIADVSKSGGFLRNCPQRLSDLGASKSVKLEPGSLFLSIAATVGKPCITEIKACIHDGFVYFPFLRENPKYLFYVFDSGELYKGLGKLGTQLNLNSDTVGAIKLSIPSRNEQDKIVVFLDRETARIDNLIAEKQNFINLLKEKRQALISHVVTKGLDPQAKMKDSGIEWLGEVPEHWGAPSLKHCCILLKDGTHTPPPRVDIGVPLLSVRNIVDGKFVFRDDDSMVSEESYNELTKYFTVNEKDVLLAIVGGTIGKTAIVEEMDRFHIQRSLAVFRTKPEVMLPEYLHLFFQSKYFYELLWANVGFSAQPGIYLGSLASFAVTLPPVIEQQQIVERLKLDLERSDLLIREVEESMELLREHRTALISAAVTGKIDVREQQ